MQWLPFDLHPEYPPEGISRAELHARYGEPFQARVREMIEEAGFRYNPPPERVPNSRPALETAELARDQGLFEQVHRRLMELYWTEATDISNDETLIGVLTEAGVDRDEAVDALADRRYGARVDEATQLAHGHGIHAIPAFVLDRRLLVMGAQPKAVFEQALAQLDEGEEE